MIVLRGMSARWAATDEQQYLPLEGLSPLVDYIHLVG